MNHLWNCIWHGNCPTDILDETIKAEIWNLKCEALEGEGSKFLYEWRKCIMRTNCVCIHYSRTFCRSWYGKPKREREKRINDAIVTARTHNLQFTRTYKSCSLLCRQRYKSLNSKNRETHTGYVGTSNSNMLWMDYCSVSKQITKHAHTLTYLCLIFSAGSRWLFCILFFFFRAF